jgi:hypothetical protein
VFIGILGFDGEFGAHRNSVLVGVALIAGCVYAAPVFLMMGMAIYFEGMK